MKLPILLAAFVTLAHSICIDSWEYTICDHMHLTDVEPVNDHSKRHFILQDSAGSIGKETVSLLKDAEELRILRTSFRRIETGALCSLPNLKRLHLVGRGELPVLLGSLFFGCNNLKSLYLANVSYDSTTFSNFVNLEELSIHDQSMITLNADFLKRLENLRSLHISVSSIKNIDSGALCKSPKLEGLELLYNYELPSIDSNILGKCHNVKYFYVHSRKTVPGLIESNALSSMSNLTEIDLQKIRIGNLTKQFFSGVPNLKYIRLSGNSIGKIEKNTFESLSNLRYLLINDTHLDEIEDNWFGVTDKIEQLTFSHSKVRTIDNTRNLPMLSILDISANNISTIDIEILRVNYPRLEYLNVAENPMSKDFLLDLYRELSIDTNITVKADYTLDQLVEENTS